MFSMDWDGDIGLTRNAKIREQWLKLWTFYLFGAAGGGTKDKLPSGNNSRNKLASNTAHAKPVVPVVVVARVDIRCIHVEVPHVVGIVPRRGPEVAVRALIAR